MGKVKLKTLIKYEKLILVLLSLPVLTFYGINQGYFWDESVYLGLAKNIQQGNYFINLNQESYRPLLFPLILATFSFLGEFIKIIPMLFTVTTVVITYYFIKKIYDEKIALIVASFIGTSPWIVYYSQRMLAETLFMLLFTASIFLIYLSTEKKKLLPLTFALFALAFLTRYQGILLLAIFFIYILTIKKTSILKTREFLLSLIVFVLLLTPWLYIGFTYYSNPYELYMDQLNNGLINPPQVFQGPFYFYIINSIGIFGISIILLSFFYRKKIFKNRFSILLLISMIIIILFFSIMGRKEYRYLISFASVFYIAGAYSLMNIYNKQRKILIYFIVVLIIAVNILMATQLILEGKTAGKNIKDASMFLQNRIDENDYLIAENYPVVNHITNSKVIPFPSTKEEFIELKNKYNVKYFVVDYGEFYIPDYIDDISSIKLVEFGEEYKVIVYEIPS